MGNPPPAVKLALESICLLLGEKATDWRAIRGVIIKDNFISTVVNFSTEDISYVASNCGFSLRCWSLLRKLTSFSEGIGRVVFG